MKSKTVLLEAEGLSSSGSERQMYTIAGMKRILFIIDSLGSGGAQRQSTTIASFLKKRGHDVRFVCYASQDFFLPKLHEANIPVEWILERRPFQRILKIRKYVRTGGYDVVISFLHTDNILNLLSVFGGRKWKVICGERSAKENEFCGKKMKLEGWLMRFADVLVCNSENAREMWMKYYPKYKDKYKVIYNSVQLGEKKSDYKPLKDGKCHVAVAASYQYLKNPIGMIEGVNLLDQEEKDRLEVDWYGMQMTNNRETKAYLESKELVAKYRLDDVIHLNSERTNITEIMQNADAVALFSWVEGLPNCICEGMMLGKPIIMTRVSDYGVLIDDNNGFHCDWDKPQTICDAFSALLRKTKNELERMGQVSMERAKELFSEDKVIKKWEDLF